MVHLFAATEFRFQESSSLGKYLNVLTIRCIPKSENKIGSMQPNPLAVAKILSLKPRQISDIPLWHKSPAISLQIS